MKLEDLVKATDTHPYMASENNYFSNENREEHPDWDEFFSEWGNCDIDYNLAFRWDVYQISSGFWLQIVFVQQRKGTYFPVIVNNLKQEDVPHVLSFLKKHFKRLMEVWNPIGLDS